MQLISENVEKLRPPNTFVTMPLAVKDFTWSETSSEVGITVPLKGVKASKVDIFSTDQYLKVSFPPFLFEVALLHPVDDEKCSAKVGDGAVTFRLVKKEVGLWGKLSCNTDDKEAMKSRREHAIAEAQEKNQELEQKKAREKQEQNKAAVKEQMRLEEEMRARIQEEKDAERRQATEEIEDWKRKQGSQTSLESDLKPQEPAPRQRGMIDVTFTPRVFPTPVRESRIPEEEAWLKKQAEARKIEDIADSDLRQEEKDPVWLKSKADNFFKAGNHLSAVNAYNLAIRLNPRLPSLHSNRSACHLKLGNYMKCIEDSSRALELLTPPVPANAQSRLKAHVRRGTAFCHLELYVEGLQDYEAALKIEPKNTSLKEDSERIRKVIQSGGLD